ncbi:hypothetical protein ACJMK2_037432 [Sinanodonta woodiana]|uniref:acetate--CoA ligase n=1 Tax=Sinanodonta woodiana TaxID=1069815 RepID=A0ABD3WKC6_SINWO
MALTGRLQAKVWSVHRGFSLKSALGVTSMHDRKLSKLRLTTCFSTSSQNVSTTPMAEFENEPNIHTHADLYQFSLQNPDRFWGTLARSRLNWFKDFSKVSDCDMKKGRFRWFLDGKLNVAVNCVHRHAEKNGDKIALIWEKDEPGTQEYVTYRQLQVMVNKLSNMLRSHGVKKGDRVAIYLPKSPIAVASMLACAHIGAIHSVVFAGFSAEALAGRIMDAKAETVITADQGLRGGKKIELKKTVDTAVSLSDCVKRVFVYQRTGADVPMGKLDLRLEKEMEKESSECKPEVLDSEDILFMLYTSGSTGKPKGITHSQAGYLLYANVTMKHVFDYKDGEIFGCVADVGWITGHSYVVYGPLSNGATTVLFESTPLYPDPGRYWEMVQRLRLNHIYLAPTSLRMLLKAGDSWVKKYDRSSLRKLGCVGEPLNHEAWEWYYHVVGDGRCDIIDTWWQTETGGICITPRPSSPGAEIKPAMPMRPFFGIEPVLMEQNLQELKSGDAKGALCIRKPWPGIARTIYGDHKRFIDTYFKTYPGIYAYIVLRDGVTIPENQLSDELKQLVKSKISSFAQPDFIMFAPGLPKTRSGKIMRRVLRKIAANKPDELGDVSTLVDPSVVDLLLKKHQEAVEAKKT